MSAKGVVRDPSGRVLLLRNERDEWELPGGKIEAGESPRDAVAREIGEETGWTVTVGPLLDAWVYEPLPGALVLIVAYGCLLDAGSPAPVLSHEHRQVGLFASGDLDGLVLPSGYRACVDAWPAP
ncbi:NUDIX hydrolase [Actinocorallia lasiicapitis]